MDKKLIKNTIVEAESVDGSVPNDFDQKVKANEDLGLKQDRFPNIDKLDIMTSNWTKQVKSFDELGLKKDLLKGIYGNGFDLPSPIQSLAIEPMIMKRDVIAQAQSGTGKTATFGISLLQIIDTSLNEVQAVILTQTRELANQNYKVIRLLGEDFLKVKAHVFIGGTSLKNDLQALQDGIHVVVGTPGRVLQMIDKKYLKLSHLKVFILDEADDMLSRGFLEDMKKAISFIPTETNIWLVSATMPKQIVELSTHFMNDPVKILVDQKDLPLSGINQYYVVLKKEWKVETLIDLYKGLDISQAMIFCNSKNTVTSLAEEMRKRGHMVSAIHSDLPMPERIQIMEEFARGATRVLISTDLLAKGIDVFGVSIVINYDLPLSKENYYHRIGRSGRFGRKGKAINFVQTDEQDELKSIQEYFNCTIEKLPTNLSDV